MRYSVEPRDRIYVKSYESLSFVINIGKDKSKTLRSKYSAIRLHDSAKKSRPPKVATDAFEKE